MFPERAQLRFHLVPVRIGLTGPDGAGHLGEDHAVLGVVVHGEQSGTSG